MIKKNNDKDRHFNNIFAQMALSRFGTENPL